MCVREKRREKERERVNNIKKNNIKKEESSRTKKSKNIFTNKRYTFGRCSKHNTIWQTCTQMCQGVRQEFTKARKCWKIKAAAHGDEDATKALKR